MKYRLLITLAIAAMVPVSVVNASEPSLLTAIKTCGTIKSDSKRLACFDAISTSKIAMSSEQTKEPASQEPTLQQKKDAFGAQALKARSKSFAEAKGEGDKELKEMTFKLLEAGKNRAGKFFFIMENGQVWRQLPADTGKVRIPRKLVDVEVIIKRKMLGSHILILNGRSIKVKRLK